MLLLRNISVSISSLLHADLSLPLSLSPSLTGSLILEHGIATHYPTPRLRLHQHVYWSSDYWLRIPGYVAMVTARLRVLLTRAMIIV